MNATLKRNRTRAISLGGIRIGGGAPISVQSMTNTPTQNVAATVAQIRRLQAAGCEIVRVAVPDREAAAAVAAIKAAVDVPLVADIHFDYRLALEAARNGADGLRINPGNIGGRQKVRAVVDCARQHGIVIRIGVNAGSLDRDLRQRYGGASAEAMVASALRQLRLLTELGFDSVKISLKASDVPRTVAAYRLLAAQTDFPLHLGITEAGGLFTGIVKSALGIGMLLADGIGDTLRVSLTRDPVEEVRVGYEILKALGLRQHGPDIISCPTCGRCEIDLFDVAARVEQALLTVRAPIKVAIMGCVVNGPGEAREADIGVAGGRGVGILFKKGRPVRKVPEDQLVDVLLEEVARLEKEKGTLPSE
jgi:(E)-4-hydroxy-3-methylbut-2-enyl-diphosphate synthase